MNSIFKKIVLAVLMLFALQSQAQTFMVDDIVISDTTTGYIDPELVEYHDSLFMTYALSNGNMWVGFLNPVNGLFISNYGKNRYLGGPWAPISMITNGPEFGWSSQGPYAYFTKMNQNGKSGIYKVEYPFVSNTGQEILLDTAFSYAGVCGSFQNNLNEPDLWFYRGQLHANNLQWMPGTVKNVWMNTQTNQVTQLQKSPITTIRWAYNTPYITYSNIDTLTGIRQVFILNTTTNTFEQATLDADDKTDPWGFHAPEYNNEFCIAANIENRYLRIYRNIGSVWTAVDSLSLPKVNNTDTLLTSIEPVYGGNGINGFTYFTVQAYNPDNSYTSIWLLGLGNHLQRRLDEGAVSGVLAERYDPESVIGENELYVYYSEQASTSRIRRCKTGVFLTNNGSGYTLTSDIQYDSIPGVSPNLLSLDIYEPLSPADIKPVMIYIHGGSWNAGDKAWYVADMAKVFTDSGYVFVSINYRLSPNPPDTLSSSAVRFPVHPRDCAKAFEWVVNNIHQYSGDTSRICLMGHSAGAHLTLLLSTNHSFLNQFSIPAQQLKCACSLDAGVFDVEEELQQAGSYIPRREPLINAFGKVDSLYDDASPQYHIEPGKYLPKLHLVHQNTPDRLYSHYRFRDSLMANGYSDFSLFDAHPYDHASIALMIGSVNDSINVTGSVMQFFSNCIQSLITEINNIRFETNQVKIFPNPTNSYINVSNLPDNFSGNILIYNAMGQLILSEEKNGSQFIVSIGHLNKGAYFVQVRNEKSEVITKTFIKL